MQFNHDQKKAIVKLESFISQYNEKIFYLIGFAGTGKTFLISNMIKKFISSGKIDHIFICAPTHKALNVFESYLKADVDPIQSLTLLEKISFMTIHKLLEFKPIIVAEDGSKVFKSTKESKFLKKMEDKLIIIDECSMITVDMIKELDKYIQTYPVKIVYLGDPKQLPPVGEKNSRVFDQINKTYNYHVQLEQIMRTNNTDIKDVCHKIRNWDLKSDLNSSLLPIHNRKGSFKLYHKKSDVTNTTWFKQFVKKINSDKIPIVLTWRNVASDKYNELIRNYLHKTENLSNYVSGDLVMFGNFYFNPIDGSNFYTSDMVKILSIQTEKKVLIEWKEIELDTTNTNVGNAYNLVIKAFSKLPNQFLVDSLVVERVHSDIAALTDKTHSVLTINRQDLDSYKEMLSNSSEKIEYFYKKNRDEKLTTKLWEIYHKKLVEPFAELNYGYSITIYKSQGSTFDSVFVDVDDVNSIRNLDDLQKALYTAAGRASNELGFII